jgi:RNA recognition motif-containing protein
MISRNQLLTLHSIVEFASPEDAQRAIRELSEVAMLGRPVFIREVRLHCLSGAIPTQQTGPGK